MSERFNYDFSDPAVRLKMRNCLPLADNEAGIPETVELLKWYEQQLAAKPEPAPADGWVSDIAKERSRQDAKWGEQNHDPFLWSAILGEEFGEACQAALQSRFGGMGLDDYRKELVEVAAVAVQAIECLDRGKWAWPLPSPPQEKEV